MKTRVVRKVEKGQMVDKICELQSKICEYDRFLGDLLVMLSRRKPHVALAHGCGDLAEWIWDQTAKLVKENEELRKRCEVGAQDCHEG